MMGRAFAGLALVAALGVVFLSSQIFETVAADEVVVIQSPVSGNLSWYATPGLKWQLFGKVTRYRKRDIYSFEDTVRFNDGGHAQMVGSIQYELPLDPEHLTAIHARFGSQPALANQLIKTVVDKSVYMTGPLMSSKESYAEKRNSLIWYVEDQVNDGVYRTLQREQRMKDPITDQEKTVTVVEIVMNKNGVPDRQEEGVLKSFAIKPFNFSITQLKYDEQVEAQIKQQQQITMDVQTAMAEAKKAEQRAVTAEKQGQAEAATSKWKQEVIKAQKVTEATQEKEVAETDAQKKLAVAKLEAEAADQYRIAQLARAAGDAEYKRQVMAADGALAQKLEAWVKVNSMYASAIQNHAGPFVPSVIMSGATPAATPASTAGGSVNDLVALFTAQTAHQLALDMSMGGSKPK